MVRFDKNYGGCLHVVIYICVGHTADLEFDIYYSLLWCLYTCSTCVLQLICTAVVQPDSWTLQLYQCTKISAQIHSQNTATAVSCRRFKVNMFD